jgi:4,5-DOPA dioxygenase extradiol
MRTRRDFLRDTLSGLMLAGLGQGCSLKETQAAKNQEEVSPEPKRMPVLFVGHGSPMNVIEVNRWSRSFSDLAKKVPEPRAILAISAHWYVDQTLVLAAAKPRTIHDFSGFPQALYEIEYPAPGAKDLAQNIQIRLGQEDVFLNPDWGFDHGTWSVLRWMYPKAHIPVIQLSINKRLSLSEHAELARSLVELREQGVLILGSGNATHNLADALSRMRRGSTETPAWASRFDEKLKKILLERDTKALLKILDDEDGKLSHPLPDHFIPLIYAYGASDHQDRLRFPTEGFDLGSVSMRSVIFS